MVGFGDGQAPRVMGEGGPPGYVEPPTNYCAPDVSHINFGGGNK